ncbi:uncharacterized protein ARB_00464 [Trichophyton benhamiae CBS 112371]|uniref:Uncharacterized protein n=1 Tax=Arthroderma benhamiae (strain ATCC MYA-4681 / CBS 112371) TaxID=663331 RepID=D4AW99_ARTBC|nr:uncharacterized protein ARB_00464 [Trichophyton benhamiae CBS 112371]EFE32639.1 hypothetical protein ARB_00464 [Trichophyton benhamiae CBS 112371]
MQSDVQDPGRLQASTANQNIPSHNYGPGYQGMDQARSARPTLPTGTPESPGKGSWKKQDEEAEREAEKKEKASKKRTYPASSAGPTMTKEVQNILDSSCFYCLYLLFPLAKGARKYLYLVAIYIVPDRLLPKTALYTVNAASWLGSSCL